MADREMRLSEILARTSPQDLEQPEGLENYEDVWRRFHEGLNPVPPAEQIGPMHRIPGRRPMTDEELRQLWMNYPPEVA